ncbi:MAG TPA: hypothetical protein VFQ39_20155, partial [Longimicrobium sp.]|nr:hypothetical protein [Longimicrobium sp.]
GRPLGTQVSVTGVVTVSSGVMDAGFAVQDESGGIYVQADSSRAFRVGQRVRVGGALTDDHGLLGILPDAVDLLRDAADPVPRAIPTGSVGEGTEGWLIETTGTVRGGVVDDRPYGWKVTIDDGSGPLLVFVPTGSRIDVRGVREGQRLRVTGLSAQYDDHHEIIPRGERDLVVLP